MCRLRAGEDWSGLGMAVPAASSAELSSAVSAARTHVVGVCSGRWLEVFEI